MSKSKGVRGLEKGTHKGHFEGFIGDVLGYWLLTWVVWDLLEIQQLFHGPNLDWKQLLGVGMIIAFMDDMIYHWGFWKRNVGS